MTPLTLFLILFMLTVLSNFVEPTRKLKFVQAMWRHGKRAPMKIPYPSDPNGQSCWPRGWNQITDKGITEMTQLGKKFLELYGTFINKNYDSTEIYVQSSCKDRALDSAQAFLQGMFPGLAEKGKLQRGIQVSKIPVHFTDSNSPDPLLRPTNIECPTYNEFVKPARNALEKTMIKKYGTYFAYLRTKTGYDQNADYRKLAKVSNVKMEILHSCPQPKWLEDTWEEHKNKSTLDIADEIRSLIRNVDLTTATLARLRGGYLLGDWLKRVQNAADGIQTNPSKMVLYSGHQETVLPLLHAMELRKVRDVGFSGCLIMELYEDDGKHVVELSLQTFNDEGVIEKQTIGHDKCPSPCPLPKFLEIFNPKAIHSVEQLHKECGVESNQHGLIYDSPDEDDDLFG